MDTFRPVLIDQSPDQLALGLNLAMYWRESFYQRSYYDNVGRAPDQDFESKVTRRNPIAQLSLSYVAW